MKNLLKALALAAALAGAQSAAAATHQLLIHGNSCFNTTSTVGIIYTQWGPYNPSTTTGVTVNCPVNLPSQNYTSMYLQISGWSRNNSATRLSCTASSTAYDGYNRTSNTAMLPFNTAVALTTWASYAPTWQNVWTYVTCYIPPNNGNGLSYLSTIYLQGTY